MSNKNTQPKADVNVLSNVNDAMYEWLVKHKTKVTSVEVGLTPTKQVAITITLSDHALKTFLELPKKVIDSELLAPITLNIYQ
jgi:hypothetical protein